MEKTYLLTIGLWLLLPITHTLQIPPSTPLRRPPSWREPSLQGFVSPPSRTLGSPYSVAARPHVRSSLRAVHKLDGKEIRGPLIPAGERVILRSESPETKSQGGILLPSNTPPKFTLAQVVAVNDHYIHDLTGVKVETNLKPGDWVMHEGGIGQKLKYDDKECLVLGARDICAKVANGSTTPADIAPLSDMIFAKLLTREEKTASGLILSTGEERNRAYDAEVVAVGPGAPDIHGHLRQPEVSVGDYIRIASHGYRGGDGRGDKDMKFGDDKYVLIRPNDVLVKW